MNKKSMDVSPPNLTVVVVLLVLVLLVLIFIFGNTTSTFLKNILGITDQTTLEVCASPFMLRYCNDCPKELPGEEIVALPPGKEYWSDCGKGKSCYQCSKETN